MQLTKLYFLCHFWIHEESTQTYTYDLSITLNDKFKNTSFEVSSGEWIRGSGDSGRLRLVWKTSLKVFDGWEESVVTDVVLLQSLSILEFELWFTCFGRTLSFKFESSFTSFWVLVLCSAASAFVMLSTFFHFVRRFWNQIFTCNETFISYWNW